MFKVNNENTRTTWNLTIKTPERRQWRRSGVFIVNFEHVSHLFYVFLMLNLNKYVSWVVLHAISHDLESYPAFNLLKVNYRNIRISIPMSLLLTFNIFDTLF